MGKRIRVLCKTDGTVSIEAHGYAGADCAKATADLERALGVVTKDTKGPDYYRAATVAAVVKG